MKTVHARSKFIDIASLLTLTCLAACGGGEPTSESAAAGPEVHAIESSSTLNGSPAISNDEPIDEEEARVPADPLAEVATTESVETPLEELLPNAFAADPDTIAATTTEQMAFATLLAVSTESYPAEKTAAIKVAGLSLETTTASASIVATSFTGKGWYVDVTSGSDMNPGTQAQPWKTLAKASSAVLATGDAILLKCGSTWRESLKIGGGNRPLTGVTLGIYGACTTGNRPLISGADQMQGMTWAVSSKFGGKPVYATKWAKPVTQLYWNGAPMTRARHPNYGGIGAEFNSVQQARTSDSFVLSAADVSLMKGINLAGATVHVRNEPWKTESAKVRSYNAVDGTVTLSAAMRDAVNIGEGYVLEDHPALPDAPGEWFHDPVTGTLYVYVPGGLSPANGVLETVQRDVGVSLRNTADARVDNLRLDRQGVRSLELIDAPRTLVTDVVSSFSGKAGIFVERLSLVTGSKGTRIVRASVNGAAAYGIWLHNSPESLIDSSTVQSTGTSGQRGYSGVGVSIADSNSSTLQFSTITKSASSGMNLGRISGVTIAGNSITRACMRFTDCGAIYNWGAPGGTSRNSFRSNNISQITPNAEGSVGGSPTLVAGIYFDKESGNTDTTGNMISNVGVGLMMLDASNNRFASNYVWPVHSASIRIHSSNSAVDHVRGNVIENNLLYGANSLGQSTTNAASFDSRTVYVQRWIHPSNASAMFTGLNPNIVRNNETGSVTDKSSLRWELRSAQTPVSLDGKQWSAISPGDAQVQPLNVNLVLPVLAGSNLIANGALTLPNAPWTYWAAPDSIGGGATFGACAGGCVQYAAGSARDSLASGVFTMSSEPGDNLYMLRFKAKSLTGVPARPTVQIARNGGDWSSLGINKWVTVPADTETISENVFVAKASLQGKLFFGAPAASVLRIREVSLRKVTSFELLDPADETVLLANETSKQKVIDCAASGLRTCSAKRLDGQAVVWPVTVPANSALAVVAADGKWLRTQ